MSLAPFHRPFFAGAGVSALALVPEPFHVGIGSHAYITDPKKCHRQFLAQLRPSVDQHDEPGEQTVNPENLWRRSTSSWHEGAGQVWFDSSLKDANRHRFRASKGLDVWTPFQLSMLKSANVAKKVAANTNLRLIYDPALDKLWLVNGVKVSYTTNPANAAPTWADATGLPGGTITGVAFTGADIYVVAGGAVYKCAAGATVFAVWYNATTVDGVQYANGRLFAWRLNEVFELTAAAAKVTLFTHPQASFVWDHIHGAPNAVYLAGHLSYSAEVYRTDVRDATGALTAPLLSGAITNERVTAMLYEGGYIILATQGPDAVGRIRLCQIVNPLYTTGGSLIVGPDMFSQLGQRPAGSIDALHSVGRFIYFSWMNLDSTCTGTGRLDLSTFTQPLVPAYASDQMAGVTGTTVQGAVLDIVYDAASGQLWFAVSGVGVYGSSATAFMQENYLYSGRIRFGLLDLKVMGQLNMRCQPLTGTTITLTVATDEDTNLATVACVGGNDTPTLPVGLPHSVAEWSEIEVVMTDSGGVSPVMLWWVLSALAVPPAIEQIVLCLLLYDLVRTGPADEDTETPFDVEAELDYLRGLAASHSIVSLQTGSRIEDVYVNNVEIKPDRLARGNRHWIGEVNVECKTLGVS